MDNLKIGFIGAGGFARHTLYPALHLAPVDLQAVCDADEGRRLSAAGKFGTGRSYADWREMCGEEEIEALIICMGPDARQGLVKDALAAGYHVFTPKPPAPSLADTMELAEAAEAAGKTMMVNFQRRFSVGARQAKAISETPEFGGLSQIYCSFCSGKYGSVHHYLLDFAIHHFDLIRRLAGEPTTIASFGNERHGQGSFAVSMEFENGAVGLMQLNSQRLWRRNYDRIEMTGHESYIVLDGLWTISHYTAGGNTFTENYSDERNSELTGDSVSLTEFVRAVREEREPQCSIQDCVKTMRLYDAVLSRRRGLIEIG